MSRFVIEKTPIDGLQVIHRQPICDDRGYLERLFCAQDQKLLLGERHIVQINHTLTLQAGAVRGMHYQKHPHAEMKLISCLRGEVFDVAVDLRRGSATFLDWYGITLTEKNHLTVCIPEGFAHGFQTLTSECELIYMHTSAFESGSEAGLNALDPNIAISWPFPITERSSRDQGFEMIPADFSGIV